jgi:hypothetical protein
MANKTQLLWHLRTLPNNSKHNEASFTPISTDSLHLIGMANKTQLLWHLWTLPNNSKHNEASFMPISTDSLRLRVAQMPRSRDLAIFVMMTDQDRQTNQLLSPLLRMREWDKNLE